jgi:hypothetical protein
MAEKVIDPLRGSLISFLLSSIIIEHLRCSEKYLQEVKDFL